MLAVVEAVVLRIEIISGRAIALFESMLPFADAGISEDMLAPRKYNSLSDTYSVSIPVGDIHLVSTGRVLVGVTADPLEISLLRSLPTNIIVEAHILHVGAEGRVVFASFSPFLKAGITQNDLKRCSGFTSLSNRDVILPSCSAIVPGPTLISVAMSGDVTTMTYLGQPPIKPSESCLSAETCSTPTVNKPVPMDDVTDDSISTPTAPKKPTIRECRMTPASPSYPRQTSSESIDMSRLNSTLQGTSDVLDSLIAKVTAMNVTNSTDLFTD